MLEVHNGSDMTLPYLSVGARWREDNSTLEGGFWLPVANIRPGKTAVIKHEGYDYQADHQSLEIFMLPYPEPEDRQRYWEFGEP